jgi:hypothetical protein
MTPHSISVTLKMEAVFSSRTFVPNCQRTHSAINQKITTEHSSPEEPQVV